jgi:hypothetical protein
MEGVTVFSKAGSKVGVAVRDGESVYVGGSERVGMRVVVLSEVTGVGCADPQETRNKAAEMHANIRSFMAHSLAGRMQDLPACNNIIMASPLSQPTQELVY